MADRILNVQNIQVSGSTEGVITLPFVDNKMQWGYPSVTGSDYYPTDEVVYVFDNFTGSFELVQNSGDTQGVTIYPSATEKQVLSGPWRLRAAPPRFLLTSGSNDQTVKVTLVLIR